MGQISDDQRTQLRALAARANYLALGRPDLAFSSNGLCRDFASPTKLSVEKLKRLARYVVHQSRLTWQFNFQDASDDNLDHLKCFVDIRTSQDAL